MLTVNFYNEIEDALLKFAVIVSRAHGKWVFCKHKERSTYECPGGRREESESILYQMIKKKHSVCFTLQKYLSLKNYRILKWKE